MARSKTKSFSSSFSYKCARASVPSTRKPVWPTSISSSRISSSTPRDSSRFVTLVWYNQWTRKFSSSKEHRGGWPPRFINSNRYAEIRRVIMGYRPIFSPSACFSLSCTTVSLPSHPPPLQIGTLPFYSVILRPSGVCILLLKRRLSQ